MTVEFSINLTKPLRKRLAKEYGMNAIYSGKHWSRRNKDADYWHNLVKSELQRQGVPRKTFRKPVHISFWFNTRMDIDNHAYIGKMVTDGLKGYLIEDDSRKYVHGVSMEFYDGDGILVRVNEKTVLK